MANFPLDAVEELFAFGVEAYRARVRRNHPDWSDEDVAERVTSWLRERPGAPDGDSAGSRVPWPRS